MEVVSVVTYVGQVWAWPQTSTDSAREQSGENIHEITMDEENHVTTSFFIFSPFCGAAVTVKQ